MSPSPSPISICCSSSSDGGQIFSSDGHWKMESRASLPIFGGPTLSPIPCLVVGDLLVLAPSPMGVGCCAPLYAHSLLSLPSPICLLPVFCRVPPTQELLSLSCLYWLSGLRGVSSDYRRVPSPSPVFDGSFLLGPSSKHLELAAVLPSVLLSLWCGGRQCFLLSFSFSYHHDL